MDAFYGYRYKTKLMPQKILSDLSLTEMNINEIYAKYPRSEMTTEKLYKIGIIAFSSNSYGKPELKLTDLKDKNDGFVVSYKKIPTLMCADFFNIEPWDGLIELSVNDDKIKASDFPLSKDEAQKICWRGWTQPTVQMDWVFSVK